MGGVCGKTEIRSRQPHLRGTQQPGQVHRGVQHATGQEQRGEAEAFTHLFVQIAGSARGEPRPGPAFEDVRHHNGEIDQGHVAQVRQIAVEQAPQGGLRVYCHHQVRRQALPPQRPERRIHGHQGLSGGAFAEARQLPFQTRAGGRHPDCAAPRHAG